MTDGTVMVASADSPIWFKLTPDNTGSYVNGTWSQIASLPIINGTQYGPLYHASAVLPDGRVIIMGGEDNNDTTGAETTLGAIYDPLADSWTAVPPPAGWKSIGDAAATVLANGTFMLASCCVSPPLDALFNAATLSWTSTGVPSSAAQAEQGFELLPDGSVLTIDIISTLKEAATPTSTERYIPASGTWISAGNTPVSLVDPVPCGNFEIGPAVLRPDGTLVAFGGNTGCVAGQSADPVAIYDSNAGVWSAGPNLPALCGAAGTTDCTLADAPAALLPNGNILFAASDGVFQSPTHFFEFTSANVINQVSDPVNFSRGDASFQYNFLVLPTGQILSVDGSNIAEIYTPATGVADASLAPSISTAPSTVVPGGTYPIGGFQFNGRSQGAYYGDDVQAATNYPLVQITNNSTGYVVYARTFDHSTMSVAPNAPGSTFFTVPQIETGASTLVVIANGIASEPSALNVGTESPIIASVLPGARSVRLGNKATIFATMINTNPNPLDNCQIDLPVSAPGGLTLTYQTTDPATNMPTGTANMPVTIAGNDGAQSFLLSFESSSAFSAPGLPLNFNCAQGNAQGSAIDVPGVDTVDLAFSAKPVADIIALSATPTGIGTITVPNGGAAAFALASVNVGATAPLTVTVDTGGASLPVTTAICETDPTTGQCLAAPAASVSLNYAAGTAPTFSVFLQSNGPIPFTPATSRIFVRFMDANGNFHGSTSVAIETQ
ncbi:MAG: hypothetical protein WCC64_23240 [Aliidongia sp.]